MHEALLYEKLLHNQVRCHVCQRRCHIPEGDRGYCLTRGNIGGKLFTLIYGLVSSLMVSPIEKKPVYHFFPGSPWLSLGSLGCNFRCPGCQNGDIAHSLVGKDLKTTRFISPSELVDMAKKNHCLGISWTYNEPTLWLEYTLEGARLAKSEGLYTNYVTNGFITTEAMDLIGPYLDVYRVDVKGFSSETYKLIGHVEDFSGILDVIKRAKEKWKMHVEIVTNIIPRFNDREEELRRLACWIKTELGNETPWHVTRFFPHLELNHVGATPEETLLKVREIGMEEGLSFVYLGNITETQAENTYCPGCGRLLIVREGLEVIENRLNRGRCPSCSCLIAGKFG
jgi:pyruvate formate lyase activating enzyme